MAEHQHRPSRSHRTPERNVWHAMRSRCHTPTDKDYKNYGARGIRVCDRWRNSFAAFLSDMGPRPSPKHSIDREDNDGNYEPGNCRWATNEEQKANTRVVRLLTLGEETMPMRAWARRLGMRASSIKARLDAGWPIERALTQPSRRPAPNGGRR